MTKGQQGTEYYPDMKKVAFSSFIPELYRSCNSFTWNFEDETFSVNQDYILHDGCIMTEECFIPQHIVPMQGLNQRYDEFLAILGYEEVNLVEEMPIMLRALLGL